MRLYKITCILITQKTDKVSDKTNSLNSKCIIRSIYLVEDKRDNIILRHHGIFLGIQFMSVD